MELDRQSIREWLQRVMREIGETPTGLARRSGLAQSTLTRFLHDSDAPMIGLRSIAKIAHATRTQPPGLHLRSPRATAGQGMRESDGVPYDPRGSIGIEAAIRALIGERNATDPWELRTHALEDAGYFPGDILLVDLNGKAEAGDAVCAQVYLWSQGKAETVFRIFEPPYILAATRDPALRRPLLVDNDRVLIKGVVTECLRRRRAE